MISQKLHAEGIELRNYNQGNQKTTCPECSHLRRKKNDPCLSVTIDHDHALWHCHNCQFKGKVANNNSYSQPQNTQKTTQTKQLKLDHSELPQDIIEWFAKRGINQDILARNKITHGKHYVAAKGSKVDCIKFNYLRDGEVVNIKYRTSDKHFTQERNAEKIYYGLDDIKDSDAAIIVEGEMDKLAMEAAGYKNVISVPDGAPRSVKNTSIEPENDKKFEYVWNCWDELAGKKIILAVDNDEPGKALGEELARRYGKDRCYRITWRLKDANETLINDGSQIVRQHVEHATPYPVSGLKSAADIAQDTMDFYDNGAQKGLSTGWSTIDEYMTIRSGELSIITGVPSSGKSEFIDALMVNMANLHGWKFAICSFENPARIHLGKLCEKQTGKSFNKDFTNHMSKQELASCIVSWASKHFSFLVTDDMEEPPTIDWIIERAKIAIARYGIKGLVIDPYNEIEHNIPHNQTETAYISKMLSKLRKFAQNHDIHIWFVAHPAKMKSVDSTVPVPTLYDISGSANWVNKADLGIVVHRNDPNDKQGETSIYVRKVRFKENGRPGMVNLQYNRANGRYDIV